MHKLAVILPLRAFKALPVDRMNNQSLDQLLGYLGLKLFRSTNLISMDHPVDCIVPAKSQSIDRFTFFDPSTTKINLDQWKLFGQPIFLIRSTD